jgi:hypothetical protein
MQTTTTTPEPFIPEGLRKQREWLDAQHAIEQPCWACGVPLSQNTAITHGTDSQGFGITFACPHCDVPMVASVPLVSVGPCYWYWSRPEGLVVTATEWRSSELA